MEPFLNIWRNIPKLLLLRLSCMFPFPRWHQGSTAHSRMFGEGLNQNKVLLQFYGIPRSENIPQILKILLIICVLVCMGEFMRNRQVSPCMDSLLNYLRPELDPIVPSLLLPALTIPVPPVSHQIHIVYGCRLSGCI